MKFNFSTNQKMFFGIWLLGTLFAIGVGTTSYFISDVKFYSERLNNLRTPTAVVSLKNNALLGQYLYSLGNWRTARSNKNQEKVQELSDTISDNLITLEVLSRKWTNPENLYRLNEINRSWYEIKVLSIEVFKSSETSSLSFKKLKLIANSITNIIDSMSKDQTELLKLDVLKNQKLISFLTKLQYWIMVLGLIFWLLISLFISRSVKHGITEKVDKVIENIKKVIRDLTASANEFLMASDQLSNTSNKLSSSTSEQAASIEETSASLDEIHSQAEMNIELSEKSSKNTEKVTSSVRISNEVMSELVGSMKEILEANKDIELLVNVIREIGEKTEVINDIVFKTQMLSFNASVEAERAGESGRGFAVVAQEVGNLAELSGKASVDISSKVKASIENARKITEKNKQKVDSGGLLVEKVAEILQEINKKAQESLDSSQSILSASKEQGMGITQIRSTMYDLEKITHVNAALSEDTSVASNMLSEQSKLLKGQIQSLQNFVDFGLQSFKAGFEVKKNDHNDPGRSKDKNVHHLPILKAVDVKSLNTTKKASGGWDDI